MLIPWRGAFLPAIGKVLSAAVENVGKKFFTTFVSD